MILGLLNVSLCCSVTVSVIHYSPILIDFNRLIHTSQPLDPTTVNSSNVTANSSVNPSNHSTSFKPKLSTTEALNLLKSQPSHFFIGKIYNRSYLLTPGDTLTLPRLKYPLGSILNFTQISQIGSRDYTLNGNPFVNNINVPLTVVEHTRSSLEFKIKFKKRKGYRRAIPSKQPFTRLKVGKIEWQQ